MHEAALAEAALPAPTMILGLVMRPYSLGHELWLIRNNNPLAVGGEPKRGHIKEAAVCCAHSWDEVKALNSDWLIRFKSAAWNWVNRKANIPLAIADFKNYRKEGSLCFPTESPYRQGQAQRIAGAPFLLRLNQWLMVHFRLSESDAWDYPLGLAHMRYCTHWEGEGSLEIYNDHDAKRDAFIAAEEAKLKEATCPA